MPPRLIINADDFGLTRGVNRAVAELHQAGALTSATLMANGESFEDAVTLAHANPGLGIGCHIVLTDGRPVLNADSIPSLIGSDRKNFRASLMRFHLAVLRGQVSGDDIFRETLVQIQRLQRAGINVTHLDSHKHTHMLPQVARPLLEAAERAGIKAVRNPFEEPWSLVLGRGSLLRKQQVKLARVLRARWEDLPQIKNGSIQTTNGTIGVSATGRLDKHTLQRLLAAMPEGTWELVCHPGYNDRDLDGIATRLRAAREIERAALLDEFGSSPYTHPELIHFGQLSQSGLFC